MSTSRRGLFGFLASAAAVPVAGVISKEPRDLVITAPGVSVSDSSFSGALTVSGDAEASISNCVFIVENGSGEEPYAIRFENEEGK